MTEELKRNLSRCVQHLEHEFTARPEWWRENFPNCVNHVEGLLSTCKSLLAYPLDTLPRRVAELSNRHVEGFFDGFNEVNKFDLQSPDKWKPEVIEKWFSDATDNFMAQIGPWISFLEFKKILAQERNDIFGRKDEIEKISGNVRKAAGFTSGGSLAIHFSKEADKQSAAAAKWLENAKKPFCTAIGVISVALALSIICYEHPATQSLFIFGKGVALISILLALGFWCGRIYRALEHQSAANRHRFLILQTLDAFTDSTENQNVKDAVLIEATRATFTYTSSGFFNTTNDNPNQSTQAMKLITPQDIK